MRCDKLAVRTALRGTRPLRFNPAVSALFKIAKPFRRFETAGLQARSTHVLQHRAFVDFSLFEQPVAPAGLPAIDLEALAVRVNQRVLLQRFDTTVRQKLVAPVNFAVEGESTSMISL